MNKPYHRDFVNSVATRLGGLEMAEEFFELHPYVAELTKTAYEQYRLEHVTPEGGATLFFIHVVSPVLRKDRERVSVEDIIDPRD